MDTTLSTTISNPNLPKLTAKSFREPVVKFIAARVGFQADATLSHHDVYGPVCSMIGVDPNAYGIAPGTSALQTHRWIQFAVMALRSEGLMSTPRKGQWGLTPEGVLYARRLTGMPVPVIQAPALVIQEPVILAPVVETPVGPVEPEPEPVKAAAPAKSLPVLKFEVDPTFAPYEEDPYLRGLAVAATNCLGYFSARSETCKTCPLHLQCRNKQAADMSALATMLRREDAETEAQRAETERKTSMGNIEPVTPAEPKVARKQWNNTSIDKIVNHVESACYRCGNPISVGATCYWRHDPNDSSNSGVFHTECL